jgi:hypothetical protein
MYPRYSFFDFDIKASFNIVQLFLETSRHLESTVFRHKLGTWWVFELSGKVKHSLVNLIGCMLIEPFNTLSVFPKSVLDAWLIEVCIGSEAMLLSISPPAFIMASVSPFVDSKSFFLVLVVLPKVTDAVCIFIDSYPLHVILIPLAEIFAPICPNIRPETCNLIISPHAWVDTPVGPDVLSLAVLSAHVVGAFVSCTFRPRLNALTVLLIVSPFSFVAGFVYVGVHTRAIGLVARPISVIDVAVNMVESSLSTCNIVGPLAFVPCAIWPRHLASSMA